MRKNPPWTPEEDEFLLSELTKGRTFKAICDPFSSKFGRERSAQALNKRYWILARKTESEQGSGAFFMRKGIPWTPEEEEFLLSARADGDTFEAISDRLLNRFGRVCSAHTVRGRYRRLVPESAVTRRGITSFSDEEEALLSRLTETATGVEEVREAFNRQTGKELSFNQISDKLNSAGMNVDLRFRALTAEGISAPAREDFLARPTRLYNLTWPPARDRTFGHAVQPCDPDHRWRVMRLHDLNQDQQPGDPVLFRCPLAIRMEFGTAGGRHNFSGILTTVLGVFQTFATARAGKKPVFYSQKAERSAKHDGIRVHVEAV